MFLQLIVMLRQKSLCMKHSMGSVHSTCSICCLKVPKDAFSLPLKKKKSFSFSVQKSQVTMIEESSVSVIPVGSSISATQHDSFHNASPSLNINAIFLKYCQEVWHSCQPGLQAEDHYSTDLLRTECFLGKYIHSFAKIKDNG